MTEDWLTSRPLAAFLASRRDNDIKVNIKNILVPLGDVYYDHSADTIVIVLADGKDLRAALGE